MSTYRVELEQDTDAFNPREEYDHAGTMVCFHKKYVLGDKNHYDFKQGFELRPSDEIMFDLLNNLARNDESTPDEYRENYCEGYDLSQIFEEEIGFWSGCNNLTPDDARWFARAVVDQGGVVLPMYLYDHSGITMSVNEFSCPWDSGQVGFIYMTTEKIKEEFSGDEDKAKACLLSEVKEYDQYLTNDVWGYRIIEDQTDEEMESCWGFFGEDYAEKESKTALENFLETVEQER